VTIDREALRRMLERPSARSWCLGLCPGCLCRVGRVVLAPGAGEARVVGSRRSRLTYGVRAGLLLMRKHEPVLGGVNGTWLLWSARRSSR
jgi:hypothetical protein